MKLICGALSTCAMNTNSLSAVVNGCCLCHPGGYRLTRFFPVPRHTCSESGYRFQTDVVLLIFRSIVFLGVVSLLPLVVCFLGAIIFIERSQKIMPFRGWKKLLLKQYKSICRCLWKQLECEVFHVFQVELCFLFLFTPGLDGMP